MIGGALALWQVGVVSRMAPVWIVIGLIIAVGLGIMLTVSSGKPMVTTDNG